MERSDPADPCSDGTEQPFASEVGPPSNHQGAVIGAAGETQQNNRYDAGNCPSADDTKPNLNDDGSNAQEARSLSLMKRIGKIKQRLSMSSSSLNYSRDDTEKEQRDRSKSLPFQMHSLVERKDENHAVESTFMPVAKVLPSEPSTLPPVGPKTSLTSSVSVTTPMEASLSFQSFSTIASDVEDESEVDHQRVTTNPPMVKPESPSCQESLGRETHEEHFVDEKRANVVETLRGAAFKRRMDVSRSRDSLLAKQQRQRDQNQHQGAAQQGSTIGPDIEQRNTQQPNERPGHFKARPLPKTTGCEGSFGLSGVPAVRKRGVTVAQSPVLGRRRQPTTAVPKASILLPPVENEGGLAGIPRVFKKPTTVPRSPMLGRRRAQSVKPRRPSLPVQRRSVESNSSASSGSLLGLSICTNKENPAPPALETPTSTRKSIQPFVPHSTKRAAQRSAFEIQRAEHEQAFREHQKRERKVLIQRLERDIEKIRLKL